MLIMKVLSSVARVSALRSEGTGSISGLDIPRGEQLAVPLPRLKCDWRCYQVKCLGLDASEAALLN